MCFQIATSSPGSNSCAGAAAFASSAENRMAPTEKAQQELEQIERQVAEMEANGPTDATRGEIATLQERIDHLRQEANAPPTAGQKPELPPHPQRPQALDYIGRVVNYFRAVPGGRG